MKINYIQSNIHEQVIVQVQKRWKDAPLLNTIGQPKTLTDTLLPFNSAQLIAVNISQ